MQTVKIELVRNKTITKATVRKEIVRFQFRKQGSSDMTFGCDLGHILERSMTQKVILSKCDILGHIRFKDMTFEVRFSECRIPTQM